MHGLGPTGVMHWKSVVPMKTATICIKGDCVILNINILRVPGYANLLVDDKMFKNYFNILTNTECIDSKVQTRRFDCYSIFVHVIC